MSLTLLKSWISPQHSNRHYAPLSRHNTYDDMERGCSQESDASSRCLDEKTPVDATTSGAKLRVNPRTIADATIGLSDGLTVPFALTAGLAALGDTDLVIYGGLAELIAGSISMGLGGYLGARSEAAGYKAALAETRHIVDNRPTMAVELVRETFADYDLPAQAVEDITSTLLAQPGRMVDFLMRFHHQLAQDDHTSVRAFKSGSTIAGGYFFGGLVPLLPYVLFVSMQVAFVGSVAVMVVALFAFGWIKTALLAEKDRMVCFRNGVQMVVLGGLAAGAAMGCVKAVGG